MLSSNLMGCSHVGYENRKNIVIAFYFCLTSLPQYFQHLSGTPNEFYINTYGS